MTCDHHQGGQVLPVTLRAGAAHPLQGIKTRQPCTCGRRAMRLVQGGTEASCSEEPEGDPFERVDLRPDACSIKASTVGGGVATCAA